MSNPKAPYWFGSDLGIKPGAERFAWPADPGDDPTTYRGEASPGYLASMTAADEIHAVSPDAQIIIAVRDPIDVLRSLHGQLVKLGIEDEPSFDPAIRRAHDMGGERTRRPRFEGYRWVLGSATASCIASTTRAGVGRSGSPIPSEMTSAPAASATPSAPCSD